MTRERVLERLHQHREELAELHVRSLALFGSVARNEAWPDSDIDLLVEFDVPVGLFELLAAKERLEEILGSRVDLVTRRGLKPRFRDTIMREAISADQGFKRERTS